MIRSVTGKHRGQAFVDDIERLTKHNRYFRRVLFTGAHEQLVLMSLKPREEIGNEVHSGTDQFFRIEQGHALFVLSKKEKSFRVGPGGAVVIPAGTYHNVINLSRHKRLNLYTIYSPPQHPRGTIHRTKFEAERGEKKRAR